MEWRKQLKMKFFKIITLLLVFLIGCSNSTPPLNKSATVNVTVKSSSSQNSFKNETLKIKLYGYNPMIADKSATLIQEITKDLSHSSKPFIYKTKIGNKAHKEEKLKYYLTVYVVDQQGKRTYYGYKNGKRGLAKVLEDGNKEVLMILESL